MRARALAALALPAAVLMLAASGGASPPSTLPGGTSFDVVVTSPHEGDVLPEGQPYTVSGRATVGSAAPVANTYLTTIVDVSGSTVNPVSTTACGNINTLHDNTANTVLDCELAAARALNNEAVTQGTVAQASIIGFAGRTIGTTAALDTEAKALDLSPTGGNLTFIPPGIDTNANGKRDFDEVLASAFNQNVLGTFGLPAGADAVGFTSFSLFTSAGNTNYWAAMTALRNMYAATPSGTLKRIVVMLSDGDANEGAPNGEPLSNVLNQLPGVTIYTFAIGNSASCTGAGGSFGTLQQIAVTRGGTCTRLANPADAVNVVPDAIGSKMSAFKLSNNGGSSFDAATTVNPPPSSAGSVPGPGSVDFSRTYPGSDATPGLRSLCAIATGSDGGGSGDNEACVNVTFKARPTVSIDTAGGTTAEGSPFSLAATSSDGVTTWSASGGTGTCTFADPASPSTSVTCDDNGLYTLTITADDGINAPVSASETLTVTNANPVPTLALSPGTIPVHGTALAQTTIVDPGTNDTQTCSNGWGDGTSSLGCDDSHVYDTAGTYTVTTTVTDDDGGTGTSTALLVVNGPPTVNVADASGAEGSSIALHATAADAEHDTLAYHWTAAPASGVDPGAACSFSDASTLDPTITCTDDGTWTLSLTVSDNVNIDVVRSGTLMVSNVNPTATLTVTPATIPLHGSTSAHTTVADAGLNDTQSCSINWGDSTPDTTGCDGSHTYDVAGSKTVTVTVNDDDGGGTTATATVVVNGPPAVSVANTAGSEGSSIALSATATDPGDTLTFAWAAAPSGTVDAGAACAFSNPAALGSSITCTDDGVWTVTLTVNDGVNPPVTSSGTVTVANVRPTLVISNPAAGGSSRNVIFNGVVTDPGSNDSETCSINWGDGTTATVPVAGGFCNATHSYAASLSGATIDASAADDNGSASTHVTRALTFNQAPVCVNVHAIPSKLWPPDGKFRIVLLIGASDPDGGHVSYEIDSIGQDEPLGKFDDDHHWYDDHDNDRYKKTKKLVPDAVRGIGPIFFLRSWRDPHGNGRVYTIAFTVTDSSGASCSGTTTVTVPKDEHHPAVKTPGVNVNSFGD